MKLGIAVALVLGSIPMTDAWAQGTFPSRPLRLVLSVPPGGAADFTGRVLAARLGEFLGQNIVVESRPGAGGIVASEYVTKATADGYTLMLSSSTTHGVAPVLYRKLPYDAMRSFTHIAGVSFIPGMMVVNSDVPAKTVKEFIELARSKPNSHRFASSGNGSAPHLLGELFNILTGAKIVHVPYKGSGPAVIGMASGESHVMFDGLPSLMAQIKAGRLRPLLALHDKRFPVLPDVPTANEAGVPGMEGGIWYGLSGPAGVPAGVVDRLARETARVIEQADVQERFASVGGLPLRAGPKEYVAFIQKENRKWGEVVRLSGAVPN
jgi:tripartite-type tricarboxylate transporter receptor subunit TctC